MSSSSPAPGAPSGEDLPRIRFHYIKSSAFRMVHADGIYGGPTTRGHIAVSFWSERPPIPTVIEHVVKPGVDGLAVLGEEVAREVKQGVVREVEMGVIMSLDVARAFRDWLDPYIKQLEAIHDGSK